MPRDDLHFRLRIPDGLKKKVELAAAENHRSITAEILVRLETTFSTPSPDLRQLITTVVHEVIAAMGETNRKDS